MIDSKVTNYKNIHKENIPYMITWTLFYAWMLIFFTWWVNSFKTSEIFAEKELYGIYILLLVFIATIAFFIKPKRFKEYINRGGIGLLLVLAAYFILEKLGLVAISKILLVLLPCFLGITYLGLLSVFIYIMNNTEKFFTIIIGNALIAILILLHDYQIFHINNSYHFIFATLFFSMLPTIKFKTEDFIAEEKVYSKTAPQISKYMYMSMFINCIILVFCRGVGRGYLLTINDLYPYNLEISFYYGGFIGVITMFIIYGFVKRSNSVTLNLIFGTFLFSIFLHFFSNTEIFQRLFATFMGISTTMSTAYIYYTLGVVSKKYWSVTYIKFNIFLIAVVGCGLGSFLGNYIYSEQGLISKHIMLMSIAIIITMLIISPLLNITFFNDDWEEDSVMANIDNLNIRQFQKYNLTTKEIEVCHYMLENLTVRQIATNMGISENTVKFHKKRIFEKLNISSKEEIFNKINT